MTSFREATFEAGAVPPPKHIYAAPLATKLHEDTIWYMLKHMPFKDMRAMLQHAPELREFYLNDSNKRQFVNIFVNRFGASSPFYGQWEKGSQHYNGEWPGWAHASVCLKVIDVGSEAERPWVGGPRGLERRLRDSYPYGAASPNGNMYPRYPLPN